VGPQRRALAGPGVLRGAPSSLTPWDGHRLLTIESVNDTLKGQLDLERHGGRTGQGVFTRIAQRLLAMAVCIWHNWATGAPVTRSLIAYDH